MSLWLIVLIIYFAVAWEIQEREQQREVYRNEEEEDE